MAKTPLADAFDSARRSGAAEPGASDRTAEDASPERRASLEATLAAVCERARALASDRAFDVPAQALAALLGGHALAAERVQSGQPFDDEALRELHLACALRTGASEPAAWFERRYVAPLGETLARMKLSDAELDEVKQRVLAKLVVASPDGTTRAEEYAGKGRLEGLVQVVATREAIGLARSRRNERPADDALFDAPGAGNDPELELVRARAGGEFKRAFEQAVRALSSRERNLLRMHLLGGVTLEQLASMYGVHRATVVRWLSNARGEALRSTKAALVARLRLGPAELESLLGVVESRLDFSVERILATLADEPAADVLEPPSTEGADQ